MPFASSTAAASAGVSMMVPLGVSVPESMLGRQIMVAAASRKATCFLPEGFLVKRTAIFLWDGNLKGFRVLRTCVAYHAYGSIGTTTKSFPLRFLTILGQSDLREKENNYDSA